MKKNILLAICLLGAALGKSKAQQLNKMYAYAYPTGAAGDYYAGYDACEGNPSNGDFYGFGTKSNNGNGLGSTLTNFNSDGTINQTTVYTSTANSFNLSYLEKAASNTYTMSGGIYDASLGTNYKGLLMNVAYTGAVNWAKAISGQFSIYGGRSFKTADGGYMYVTDMNNSSQGADDVLLVKMTSTGGISWSKYIGRSNNDGGVRFTQLSNGNYAIAFQSMDASMNEDWIVAILNQAGTEVTHKVFSKGSDIMLFFNDITASNDRIYISGAHDTGGNTEPIIISLDYNLNIKYSTSYSANGWPGFYNIELNGENLIVAGGVDGLIGGSDVLMLRIDTANGGIISSKVFGTANNEGPGPIRLGANGQMYIAMGESNYNGSFTEEYQSVLVMDNSLTLGCNEASPFFTEGTYMPTTSTTNLGVSSVSISTIDVSSYINTTTEAPNPAVSCSVPMCNMSLSIGGMTEPPFCNGDYAYVDVSVSGNTTPSVTYSWTGTGGFTSDQEDIGVQAGTYDLYAVDGNGCEATLSYTVTEPPVLEITSATLFNPTCFGDNDGSINITFSGGNPPVYYPNWTGPNSYTATVEDISGLQAGTYNITISDDNGCSTTGSYTLTQPPALNLGLTGTNVSCNGVCDGAITANVTGGTGAYVYSWNGFTETSNVLSSLCAGTFNYTVTVTDDNNCSVSTNTNNENVTINEPAPLLLDVTATNSTCGGDNGTASAVTFGGTQPYTLSWSTGDGNVTSIANVTPGTHTATLVDQNNCTETFDFVVSDTVYPVNICVVTVDTSSTKNQVVWEKPVLGYLDGFNVYRDVVGNYTYLDFVDYDSLSTYIDSSAGINPNTTSYRYKITAVDTCGNESVMSDFHETIHLTVNQGASNEVNLVWDAYEGISFVYYRIMRDTLLDGSWHPIDSVTNSNFTFTDWGSYDNGANYMIEIVLPTTCTATKAQGHNSTRSNRASIAGGSTPDAIVESVLNNVLVYPNPAEDLVVVDMQITDWTYKLTDIHGKMIDSGQSKSTRKEVSLDQLDPGVYFMTIDFEGRHTVRKIVKQ